MSAIILSHPRHRVTFDPPHADPREQRVMAGDDSTPPPHLRALRGTLPADRCAGCGEPIPYHYDTQGLVWLGCVGVAGRKRLADLIKRPLGNTAEYGDPFPHVSRAIGDVLRVGAGPHVATCFETLDWQERIDLERRIADVAIAAYKKGEGQ